MQVVNSHRKTMNQLKAREASLKVDHKVPKDVEMTPLLQKLIVVETNYKTCSDETYATRREAEKFALDIEATDKALYMAKTEFRELEKQTSDEKAHIERLEKSTNETHKRVVNKLVVFLQSTG